MNSSIKNQVKKRKTSKKIPSKPFWNDETSAISQQWGLDTMHSMAAKKFRQKIRSDSWFSVVEHPQAPIMNNSVSLPLSSGVKKELIRARKIRIYPTTYQKEALKKWFGCQRYIYNRALKMYNDGIPIGIKTLREQLLNKNTNVLEPWEQWLNEYQYDLKDESLRDLIKNYNSNVSKFKKTGRPFKLKLKTKKAPFQTLSVLKKYWNKGKKTFYDGNCSQNLPSLGSTRRGRTIGKPYIGWTTKFRIWFRICIRRQPSFCASLMTMFFFPN